MTATSGIGTSATNLRLVYEAADQPGGELPEGLEVTLNNPINLGAQSSAVLPITLSGDNSSNDETLVLRVVSDENPLLATITLNLHLAEAKPALNFTPNFLEIGVAHESSASETVTFTNVGLANMTDMQLSVVDENGQPAPTWVRLLSPANQGSLNIGEQKEIRIAVNPGTEVTEGIYPLRLLVESSNTNTTHVNLYVAVTQSGVGSVLFKASDIYTATLDGENNPIPGLANARIRVQNEIVLSIEETLTTDQYGEAIFADLPTGNYQFRASAGNHQDVSGRFTVKPGITGIREVFLDYNLVTVEWSVSEITIEDKYEITLQALFETDVPAAVVVQEPASVTLPDMVPGEILYGELKVTNHGLIRANDIELDLPGSDEYFRYEFLDAFPATLSAKESRIIPYRITSLAPVNPDGGASGGGCRSYQEAVIGEYSYICANDVTSGGRFGTHFITRVDSSTCGGGGSPGEGLLIWYGGGQGGPLSSSSAGGNYSPISGAKCIPDPGCEDECCGGGGPPGGGEGGH